MTKKERTQHSIKNWLMLKLSSLRRMFGGSLHLRINRPLLIYHIRFHPGYLTKERLAKAKKLKIAITAGIGITYLEFHLFLLNQF